MPARCAASRLRGAARPRGRAAARVRPRAHGLLGRRARGPAPACGRTDARADRRAMNLQLLQVHVDDTLPPPVDAGHRGGRDAPWRPTPTRRCAWSSFAPTRAARRAVRARVGPAAHVALTRAPGGRRWDPYELGGLARALRGGRRDAPAPEGFYDVHVAKRVADFQLNHATRQRATAEWLRVRFPSVGQLRGAKRRALALATRGRKGLSVPDGAAHVRDVCEHLVSPDTKFLDDTGLRPSGWLALEAHADACEESGLRYTHAKRSGCAATSGPSARCRTARTRRRSPSRPSTSSAARARTAPSPSPSATRSSASAPCSRARGLPTRAAT